MGGGGGGRNPYSSSSGNNQFNMGSTNNNFRSQAQLQSKQPSYAVIPPQVPARKTYLESPTFAKGEDDIYRWVFFSF